MKQLKKAGRFLCSMKFAMILLLILVLACTVGSVIPQGETASWYTANYSRQAAGAVMLFGLDDVFHSWWFILLTLFLCLNLLCCNVLRFPALMRRMRGFTPVKSIVRWDGRAVAETSGNPEKLFSKLGFRGVHRGKIAWSGTGEDRDAEEQECAYLYACRNKIGIWGAWLCHLGMLVVIAGFALGQTLKSEYTVYGVPGQTKPVGDTGYELTIDDFEVRLRKDATVDQYTAKLTLQDTASGKKESGEASVNAPYPSLE